MATTYLGAAAFDQVAAAQAQIDKHMASTPGGRCHTCGEVEPCGPRAQAHEVFARYGVLPKRRPGMTKAGLHRVSA